MMASLKGSGPGLDGRVPQPQADSGGEIPLVVKPFLPFRGMPSIRVDGLKVL